MRFVVTITQDEDGMYVAECPSVPGCVSQGKSAEEAEVSIKEAIKACLEVRADKGLPLVVTRHGVGHRTAGGSGLTLAWFSNAKAEPP